MNKQELICKLKKLLETPSELEGFDFDDGYDFGIESAIALAEELDEPVRPPEPKQLEIAKPVVPQFVADWYEANKEGFENNVYDLCVQFNNDNEELNKEVWCWFDCAVNKPFETLVKMKLFGYDVDKEKLYRVELPNPNGDSNRYGLCKVDGRVIIGSFVFGLNKAINTKLTESEIKEDFEWAWQFAKEVE